MKKQINKPNRPSKSQQRKWHSQPGNLPIIFLIVSIICLLIGHSDFNQFYWFFIVGLIGFSFTTAFIIVSLLEYFLPPSMVNHQLWTGVGIGGKGLAGLIVGILAIIIMLGFTYMLKALNVGYIT
jgi:hypothetical protein